MTTIAGTLTDFTRRFQDMHATVTAVNRGDITGASTEPIPHSCLSPLAMWAQLAMLGKAADAGPEDIVPSPAIAAQMIDAVFALPHPACVLRPTMWLNPLVDNADLSAIIDRLSALRHWVGDQPPPTEQLDTWASANTWGLIPGFPVGADNSRPFGPADDAVADVPALTSGIAFGAHGRWAMPLEIRPAGSLTQWSVDRVLRTRGPDCGLAWDPQLGFLGVTVNRCSNGLFTLSVIGDPTLRGDAVSAAAARLVRRFATGERIMLRGDELPVGDGGWWRVGSDPAHRSGWMEQQHNCAVLPAWTVGDSFDLMAYGLGYWSVLQKGLCARIGAPFDTATAGHSACARFDTDGVVAAAVNGTQIVHGGWQQALLATVAHSPTPDRPLPPGAGGTIVELEYRHPFAVVVATSSEQRGHFWQGLPLHVTWVAEATEPTTERPG
ncbi:hypothetical protein AAFP35_08335 [Gordonia sp. CPCC 206044]|uniref:hypothetical protein n=1 Tax=Gordonia sp. CPCC 206044 TaxID=3140793 RepID=UPI003AF3509E